MLWNPGLHYRAYKSLPHLCILIVTLQTRYRFEDFTDCLNLPSVCWLFGWRFLKLMLHSVLKGLDEDGEAETATVSDETAID